MTSFIRVSKIFAGTKNGSGRPWDFRFLAVFQQKVGLSSRRTATASMKSKNAIRDRRLIVLIAGYGLHERCN